MDLFRKSCTYLDSTNYHLKFHQRLQDLVNISDSLESLDIPKVDDVKHSREHPKYI